jgi:hypothetical protein
MMILFRLLPWIVALLEGAVFWMQLRHPLLYPWIVLIGVVAMPLATVVIAWRRFPLRDAFERMLPSFVLMASLAFALLLSEGAIAIWCVIALAMASAFISLEMLFLMVYDPPRYPVNGLSRANIAYVPVAVWYAASTSNGLLVFLHAKPLWHIALMTVMGTILFRTTGHTDATGEEKAVWMLLGAVIGAQVGLLGVMLPVAMPVHGLIAALILSSTLRVRRYLYHPKPSSRQAWIEGALAAALFVATLATAKWL